MPPAPDSSASAEASARPPGRVWRDAQLQLLFAATIVSVLGVSAVAPAFPKIVRALGISQQEVGLLITAYTLPGVLLTPFLGVLADQVGRKKVLVGALLSFGLIGTACAFVRDFELLLGLRVLQGIGSAPVVALNVTIISDLYDGPERTAAIGYNSAALNVGTASYPAIGGAVAAFAWYWPFALPVIALPVALWIAARLDVPEPDNGSAASFDWQRLGTVLRRRTVLALLASSVIFFMLLFGSYLTYLPELLNQRFTTRSLIIGLVVSSASISNGTTAAQLERLTRIASKPTIIIGGFAVAAAALAALPLMPNLVALVGVAIVFGAALGAGITAILTLLTQEAPPEQRATILSINTTAIRLGQTLGPVAAGLMLTAGGLNAVFHGGAVLALIMAAVTLVLFRFD